MHRSALNLHSLKVGVVVGTSNQSRVEGVHQSSAALLIDLFDS